MSQEQFTGKMYTTHSGNLKRIGWEYDSETKQGVLRVEFKNGSQYDYFPVPKEKFSEYFSSESKGSWFDLEIKKNPTISYEKVDEENKSK